MPPLTPHPSPHPILLASLLLAATELAAIEEKERPHDDNDDDYLFDAQVVLASRRGGSGNSISTKELFSSQRRISSHELIHLPDEDEPRSSGSDSDEGDDESRRESRTTTCWRIEPSGSVTKVIDGQGASRSAGSGGGRAAGSGGGGGGGGGGKSRRKVPPAMGPALKRVEAQVEATEGGPSCWKPVTRFVTNKILLDYLAAKPSVPVRVILLPRRRRLLDLPFS